MWSPQVPPSRAFLLAFALLSPSGCRLDRAEGPDRDGADGDAVCTAARPEAPLEQPRLLLQRNPELELDVAPSPDDRYLATVTTGGQLEVWALDSGRVVARGSAGDASVYRAGWLDEHTAVVTATQLDLGRFAHWGVKLDLRTGATSTWPLASEWSAMIPVGQTGTRWIFRKNGFETRVDEGGEHYLPVRESHVGDLSAPPVRAPQLDAMNYVPAVRGSADGSLVAWEDQDEVFLQRGDAIDTVGGARLIGPAGEHGVLVCAGGQLVAVGERGDDLARRTLELPAALTAVVAPCDLASVSADLTRAVSLGPGGALLWDLAAGRPVRLLPTVETPTRVEPNRVTGGCGTFACDRSVARFVGRNLLIRDRDDRWLVVDPASGRARTWLGARVSPLVATQIRSATADTVEVIAAASAPLGARCPAGDAQHPCRDYWSIRYSLSGGAIEQTFVGRKPWMDTSPVPPAPGRFRIEFQDASNGYGGAEDVFLLDSESGKRTQLLDNVPFVDSSRLVESSSRIAWLWDTGTSKNGGGFVVLDLDGRELVRNESLGLTDRQFAFLPETGEASRDRYAAATDASLVGFDGTGTELWSTDLGAPIVSLDAVGELFLVSTSAGRVATITADGVASWFPDNVARIHAATLAGGTLFTVDDSGAIGLWDTSTRRLRGVLVGYQDGEHIALTTDGHHISTPELRDRVTWVFSPSAPGVTPTLGQTGPLSATVAEFGDRLQDAEHVRAVLAGRVAGAPGVPRPPRLSEPVREGTAVRVGFESTGLVATLRAFVDGRVVAEQTVCAASGTERLAVPEAGAEVSVVAFGADGTASQTHTLRAAEPTQREPADVWVVAVGVSRYPALAADFQLEYADDDARAIHQITRELAGDERVHGPAALIDAEATPAGILAALEGLRAMQPDDVAVVFLAGHGVIHDGAMVFLTGETGAPGSTIEDTSVRWDDIARALSQARGTVMVLLDACHAGAVTENVVRNEALVDAMLTGRRGPTIVFAAAKGRQQSLEPAGRRALELQIDGEPALEADAPTRLPFTIVPHGYFTAALLAAMGSETTDLDADGYIEAHELVDRTTAAVADRSKGAQTPWVARYEAFGEVRLLPTAAARIELPRAVGTEAELRCQLGSLDACVEAARVLGGQAETFALAADLYELACARGSGAGCGGLAWAYLSGEGRTADPSRSHGLARTACLANDPQGCDLYGHLVRDPVHGDDPELARPAFERACRLGSGSGCTNLGVVLSSGPEGARERARAIELWTAACPTHAYACTLLAAAYRDGFGVTRSLERAAAYATQGCRAGDRDACAIQAELGPFTRYP